MSIVRLRCIAPLAACLIAAACGSAGGAVSHVPTPSSAAAGAAAAARCQALLQRQIAPCPPANLALEPIAIEDGTHGTVPEPELRAQGQAYIRAHALYRWAVGQADGDRFLLSGAIVPTEVARTSIFRGEVEVFADARTAGGRAHVEPPHTTQITLVAVPPSLQGIAERDGMQPSDYAWVDNQMGPAHAWIDLPDGSTRDVVRVGSGQPEPILVFGQMRSDPELGTIWYAGGEFNCLGDSLVRAICGL